MPDKPVPPMLQNLYVAVILRNSGGGARTPNVQLLDSVSALRTLAADPAVVEVRAYKFVEVAEVGVHKIHTVTEGVLTPELK